MLFLGEGGEDLPSSPISDSPSWCMLTWLLLHFCRNSASETIEQKLVYVGSEEGKLLALRQSFAEV